MIALLQRVSRAWVDIAGERVAGIGPGLLVLWGVEKRDSTREADRLLQRVLDYRVFADAAGRMNLDLREVGGELLLVPQFTLAADTRKGRRPGFSTAAGDEAGRRLFAYAAERAAQMHPGARFGRFGATMQVGLVNDGPVTFRLRVAPAASA